MNLRQLLDQDQGLGDTVKKVVKAVGLKPCKPCEKRAAWLNKLIPYKKEK
jgi:hypothetical protein